MTQFVPTEWIHLRGAAAIVDDAQGLNAPGDVWIHNGRVHTICTAPDHAAPIPAPEADVTVVDASGCLIAPLFLDIHVHLREPGNEQAETIATGAASAWAGGYGCVYAMANTNPVCDRPSVVEYITNAARGLPVEVVPVGALSEGLRGRTLVDYDEVAAAGVGAFSDDGAWLADPALMNEAFRWSARNNVPVFQHCEDFDRTGAGVLHACACVHDAGLPGIPSDSEIVAIERDIRLAHKHTAALHVCHLSTAQGAARIREAQSRGEPITAEVAPHHLLLTALDAVAGGPNFKMKPPLRDASDTDALVDAIVDGTIAALATDHAPHTAERKASGMRTAPFGIVGLETAFPAVFTGLVKTGRLSLARLVALLTTGPAAVARRAAPTMRVGEAVGVTLIDLDTERPVRRAAFRSKSQNTPFDGQTLRGWPMLSLRPDRMDTHVAEFDERIRSGARQ